jgi:hypothetical protein
MTGLINIQHLDFIDKEKFMKTTPKHKPNYHSILILLSCVYFRSKKKIQQIDVNKKSFQTRIVYDIFVSYIVFRIKRNTIKNKTKQMKFIVSSSYLLKQLQVLGNVINSSNTLPILDNFFDLDHNVLTVSASDLETTMSATLGIDSESEALLSLQNCYWKSLKHSQNSR